MFDGVVVVLGVRVDFVVFGPVVGVVVAAGCCCLWTLAGRTAAACRAVAAL